MPLVPAVVTPMKQKSTPVGNIGICPFGTGTIHVSMAGREPVPPRAEAPKEQVAKPEPENRAVGQIAVDP